MSKYRITDADLPYAAEFKTHPVGFHSPGLQRVLNVLRGGLKAGNLFWSSGSLSRNGCWGDCPQGAGNRLRFWKA